MNQAIKLPGESVDYKRILVDGVRYYGKHLILTARHCNENLLEIPAVTRFMTDLVERIDMVAYGEPLCARFGGGIETGISGVQLIETSAIVIHTNDKAREMYLDVFSCKGYSEIDVIDFVTSTFGTEAINFQVLLRN